MTDKFIELLHGDNTNNKLTVTPTRITIKFKKGNTQEQDDRVEDFLIKVAHLVKHHRVSLRGMLNDTGSEFQIVLRGTVRGGPAFRFCELDVKNLI